MSLEPESNPGFLAALWGRVRPYLTVARVTAALAAVLGPPLALLSGKLAVLLADLGYQLTAAQIEAAFYAGIATFLAVAVPALVKFFDNRTKFETALIEEGRPELIQNRSVGSSSHYIAGVPGYFDPDDDAALSLPDDIAESDADPDEAPERRTRLPETE